MKPYIKIATIIGAGLIIGTVGGKFIFSEKASISKLSKSPQKSDPRLSKRIIEESDRQADEMDNFFI